MTFLDWKLMSKPFIFWYMIIYNQEKKKKKNTSYQYELLHRHISIFFILYRRFKLYLYERILKSVTKNLIK